MNQLWHPPTFDPLSKKLPVAVPVIHNMKNWSDKITPLPSRKDTQVFDHHVNIIVGKNKFGDRIALGQVPNYNLPLMEIYTKKEETQ